MREIKFRGRTVNEKWVYGLLTHDKNHDKDFEWFISNKVGKPYAYGVISETVGQYTGLKDKNGKEIYEGDIVKTQKYADKPHSKNKKYKRFIGVVEYLVEAGNNFRDKETGKWDKRKEYGARWRVVINDPEKKGYRISQWGDFFDCEVIGNIHENPELI